MIKHFKKLVDKRTAYNTKLKTNLRRIAAGSLDSADFETRRHIKRKYSKDQIYLARKFVQFEECNSKDQFKELV